MTVDELIAALLKQDKNAEVAFNDEKHGVVFQVDDIWQYHDEVMLGGQEQ